MTTQYTWGSKTVEVGAFDDKYSEFVSKADQMPVQRGGDRRGPRQGYGDRRNNDDRRGGYENKRFDDGRGAPRYDDRRGGYDRRGDDRRGDDRRNDRSYEDRRGGYDDRRSNYDDRRGGYDRRGDDRRNDRSYEDRRSNYDNRKGSYEDRRNNYDDRRSNYDDRRGGYDQRRNDGGRGRSINNEPSTQIGMFNLDYNLTEDDIYKFLNGNIPPQVKFNLKYVKDFNTNNFRGFCFVSFDSLDESKEAFEALSGKSINNRVVSVSYSKKRERN